MSVIYNNAHSITFINPLSGGQFTYRRSWYDFHLIPVKRPSVAAPTPNIKLINIPGSLKRLDMTESSPGGLTFGRRKGQWEFYVITDKWGTNWARAKATISNYLHQWYNGKAWMNCVLEDEHQTCYGGHFSVVGWENENGYPKVTIEYDLLPETWTNTYSYSLVPAVSSIVSSLRRNAPTFILGDPITTTKIWIETLATYDNGVKELVDATLSSSGGDIFVSTGVNRINTAYKNQTSYVNVEVIEGKVVGLKTILRTNYDEAWQGSDADSARSLYRAYKLYENGYYANEVSMDSLSGVLGDLGYNTIPVTSGDLTGQISVFVKRYESLEPAYRYFDSEGEHMPVYMRVGDYSDRLKNYLSVSALTNRGRYESVSSTDWNIEIKRFDTTGRNDVAVSGDNRAIGEYNKTVYGSAYVDVLQAFDVIESWEIVNQAIFDGSYKTQFKIGDLVWLELGEVYKGYAQIAAFDTDLSEDGDMIPITWILREALETPVTHGQFNYIDSQLKTYVDSLENYFPNYIQPMLKTSYKEYGYNGQCTFMKLWVPSLYEATGQLKDGDFLVHDAIGNLDINYTGLLNNGTERVRYRNNPLMNMITGEPHYSNSVNWWTRNNRGSQDIIAIFWQTGSTTHYSNSSGSSYVTLGFCTDSNVHDENIDWVLSKFRAIFSQFELYSWDIFGLDETSNNNTVRDACIAESYYHIAYNPSPSDQVELPGITFVLSSETQDTYVYNVRLYDYSQASNFVARYITRFSMEIVSVVNVDDHYVFYCTMTTNKIE